MVHTPPSLTRIEPPARRSSPSRSTILLLLSNKGFWYLKTLHALSSRTFIQQLHITVRFLINRLIVPKTNHVKLLPLMLHQPRHLNPDAGRVGLESLVTFSSFSFEAGEPWPGSWPASHTAEPTLQTLEGPEAKRKQSKNWWAKLAFTKYWRFWVSYRILPFE